MLQLVHFTSLVLPSRHSTGSCLESLWTCHQVHVAYQRCSLSSRRVNNSYLYCCRRIDAYTNIKLRCHQFIPAVHTRRRAIGPYSVGSIAALYRACIGATCCLKQNVCLSGADAVMCSTVVSLVITSPAEKRLRVQSLCKHDYQASYALIL